MCIRDSDRLYISDLLLWIRREVHPVTDHYGVGAANALYAQPPFDQAGVDPLLFGHVHCTVIADDLDDSASHRVGGNGENVSKATAHSLSGGKGAADAETSLSAPPASSGCRCDLHKGEM